jgi:hypothetical protein
MAAPQEVVLTNGQFDVGDEKTARGIIENTKEPYFKLESALYLKRTSGETPDSAYEERLNQYIDKKLVELNMGLANFLGRLSLSKLMLEKGDDMLNPRELFKNGPNSIDYNQFQFGCGEGTLEYAHEELMGYQIKMLSAGVVRFGVPMMNGSNKFYTRWVDMAHGSYSGWPSFLNFVNKTLMK